MEKQELEHLRYPIGRFEWVTDVSPTALENHINAIREFPIILEKSLAPYTETLLKKRYRPGGWTIAQLVHHLADSHTHSYVRFKHAILEAQTPEIKDYNEDDWANTPDGAAIHIAPSLLMIQGIHERWATFLSQLQANDFKKAYHHPQRKKSYPIDTATALYAWHGEHHIAHIQNALHNPFD